jgi:hypothetical protein
MNYNILDFCEIIENDSRISHMRNVSERGVTARIYQSSFGTTVVIDTTDPEPTDSTLKGFLVELGLKDRISGMFPRTA